MLNRLRQTINILKGKVRGDLVLSEQQAYLIGLIIGRGRLFHQGRIVIEFSHTNKLLTGIARCPKCNSASTQNKKIYKCKNVKCAAVGFSPIQNIYDQVTETQDSIIQTIIPYLKKGLLFRDSMINTESITLLVLDFDVSGDDWQKLIATLGQNYHFHRGTIPQLMNNAERSVQIEFINGVLDSSGFANAGGWLPRKGLHVDIRQRIYLQVVRNWRMAVLLDNFLRRNFQIPIQTIDWGHPNMRDPNLVEASSGKASAYAREHQIKIYPEFLQEFHFRISHKQKMFEELLKHNKDNGFTNHEDWFPPSEITSFKPLHPDEQNPRMDIEVRRHFDAFWQINLALGCEFLDHYSTKAVNKEIFALTGETDNSMPVERLLAEIEAKRPIVTLKSATKSKKTIKYPKAAKRAPAKLELATYPILKKYFDEFYFDSEKGQGEFFITNYSTLSAFMKDQPKEFVEQYEECEEFKIRPDLVGFDKKEKKLIFVESKVEPLDMRMVGQLLGYCLVAEPNDAYLLSTETVSPRLVNALSANPTVLDYSENKRIKIGQIINNKVLIHDF